MTDRLGYKHMAFQRQAPTAPRDMNRIEIRYWTLWFCFAVHFERRTGIVGQSIASWIAGRDRKTNAGDKVDPRFPIAANFWLRIADDYSRNVDIQADNYYPAIDRPVTENMTRIRTWKAG